jgi:hypothetical protein
MKKSLFCFLLVILISGSIKAQLANTTWKGVLHLESPVNVSFSFGKDTLSVMNLDQNAVLETMIYTATNSTFIVVKIMGQSECDASTVGKYKYQITGGTMLLTLVDDMCQDRGPVLNNMKLMKNNL